MNRKILTAIALGLGGLLVALVLTVGAFAIAGQEISQPAGVPVFTTSPSPSPDHDRDETRSPEAERTGSVSQADDHGGNSGDSTGSDDSSGSGSGESDSSGSGSDDSGGGSSDSRVGFGVELG